MELCCPFEISLFIQFMQSWKQIEFIEFVLVINWVMKIFLFIDKMSFPKPTHSAPLKASLCDSLCSRIWDGVLCCKEDRLDASHREAYKKLIRSSAQLLP